MEFWVSLIHINEADEDGWKFINDNGTHVSGDYFLYEGSTEFVSEGIESFVVLGEAMVPSLGAMNRKQLIELVIDQFDLSDQNRKTLEYNLK